MLVTDTLDRQSVVHFIRSVCVYCCLPLLLPVLWMIHLISPNLGWNKYNLSFLP